MLPSNSNEITKRHVICVYEENLKRKWDNDQHTFIYQGVKLKLVCSIITYFGKGKYVC